MTDPTEQEKARARALLLLEKRLNKSPKTIVSMALEVLDATGYRAPSRTALWWATARDGDREFPLSHWLAAGRLAVALLRHEARPIELPSVAGTATQIAQLERDTASAAAFVGEEHEISFCWQEVRA